MRVDFVDIDAAARIDPDRSVVVVDVMRAFTTAAWAFHLGADRIVLFAHLDDALAFKAATPGALAFCDGAPKEGFDLFNSPGQLLDLDVAGRPIAQRTTAGTQGAVAAGHANLVLCTGFVTAAATARLLTAKNATDVVFVITGGDEDLACAEHISCALSGNPPDSTYVDRARHSPAARDLLEGVRLGYRGVDPADVDICLDLDRFDFALQATRTKQHLTLKPVTPS